jgi:hypothetical protein
MLIRPVVEAALQGFWVAARWVGISTGSALRVKLGTMSIARGGSSLAGHISRIIGACSFEKVPGVDAYPTVAGMADTEPHRILACMQEKGNTRCDEATNLLVSEDRDSSIASGFAWSWSCLTPEPIPASVMRKPNWNTSVESANLSAGERWDWFRIVDSHAVPPLDRLVCRTAFEALRGFSILPWINSDAEVISCRP